MGVAMVLYKLIGNIIWSSSSCGCYGISLAVGRENSFALGDVNVEGLNIMFGAYVHSHTPLFLQRCGLEGPHCISATSREPLGIFGRY